MLFTIHQSQYLRDIKISIYNILDKNNFIYTFDPKLMVNFQESLLFQYYILSYIMCTCWHKYRDHFMESTRKCVIFTRVGEVHSESEQVSAVNE